MTITPELVVVSLFALTIGIIAVKVAGKLLKVLLILGATVGVLYALVPDVVSEMWRQLVVCGVVEKVETWLRS